MTVNRQRPGAALVVFLATAGAAWLAMAGAAGAQGLSSEKAIETIIGSEVREEEAPAAASADKVAAAIDKTSEAIDRVRKTSNLKEVEILFLPDATTTEGGPPQPIEAKLKEKEAEITELRKELEGNAMLYHAIDSRSVMTRDVLAVEFPEDDRVIIYAAAKPPA
ncbi:MAG: hypothetical protein ABTQ31_00380 [Rhizobiaceae bacterium]